MQVGSQGPGGPCLAYNKGKNSKTSDNDKKPAHRKYLQAERICSGVRKKVVIQMQAMASHRCATQGSEALSANRRNSSKSLPYTGPGPWGLTEAGVDIS